MSDEMTFWENIRLSIITFFFLAAFVINFFAALSMLIAIALFSWGLLYAAKDTVKEHVEKCKNEDCPTQPYDEPYFSDGTVQVGGKFYQLGPIIYERNRSDDE